MACKRSMDCTCPQCAAASAEFSVEDLKQFSSAIDYGEEGEEGQPEPEPPIKPKPVQKRKPNPRPAAAIPIPEAGELEDHVLYALVPLPVSRCALVLTECIESEDGAKRYC